MRFLAAGLVAQLWCVPATAQDSCVVQGRLLGHDGRPMRGAYVKSQGPGSISSRPAVGRDGSFTASFPRPGGYFLLFAGVHHRTWFMPLLLEHAGATRLQVLLSAAEYPATFDSVLVVGDFNRYAAEGAIPMARRPDGTFVATVPCDQDTLRYQLLGAQDHGDRMCGTQADTFVVVRGQTIIEDRSSLFVSVLVAHRHPVEIVFDPRQLPRGASRPVVAFAGSPGYAGRIVAIQEDSNRRTRRFTDAYDAFKATGAPPDSFHWDPSPDLKDLAAQVDRERDPLPRGFLLLTYIEHALGAADSNRARALLRDIPPDSPLWSLLWGGPFNAFDDVASAAKDPAAVRAYAEKVVEVHPDSSVRVDLLYHLLGEAHRSGDLEDAGRYFTRLTSEYAATRRADMARKEFAPNRAIQKGHPAPEFAFASLQDSTRVFRASDFRGKYLLLDFWATWCGPCVYELRYLHGAYERYKDRGLVMLSVSFDGKPGDVDRFRGSRWPMPWLQAFQPGGFASDAARAFEIAGIPRPILIDPDGRIVAVDGELRGEALERTLAAVVGTPAAK